MQITTLIPHDKALHALGGSFTFSVARAVGQLAGLHPENATCAALAAVMLVAIAKEWYDHMHRAKHTLDPWDAAFTIAGGVLGASSALSLS